MILAVLSDIHSNPWALAAAIRVSRKMYGNEVRFCFLGDVIGYGPRPLECIQQIKQLDEEEALYRDHADGRAALVAGNHEYAWWYFEQQAGLSAQLDQIAAVDSPDTRLAQIINLTQQLWRMQERPGNRASLKVAQVQALVFNMLALRVDPKLTNWYRQQIAISDFRQQVFSGSGLAGWTILLVHASLEDPVADVIRELRSQLPEINRYMRINCRTVCDTRAIFLHGHTHIPMWFSDDRPNAHDIIYHQRLHLGSSISLLNPGSVGQPRDHDIRPAFMILDLRPAEATVEFVRLPLRGEDGLGNGQAEPDQDSPEEPGPDSYTTGRAELMRILEEGRYPEEIQGYFKLAKYAENGSLTSEVRDYLDILKRRAGENWIAPEENH